MKKKLKSPALTRLRTQRRGIQSMIITLKKGPGVQCTPGAPRRGLITSLTAIASNPNNHAVNPLLLHASLALLSYLDTLALAILHQLDADYLRDIKKEKELTRMRIARRVVEKKK